MTEVDKTIENILSGYYEKVAKTSPGTQVRASFDTISKYRELGLTFEQIAEALTDGGIPIKAPYLKVLFGRIKKEREKAVSAAAIAGAAKPAAQVIIPAPAAPEKVAAAVAAPAPSITPLAPALAQEKQPPAPTKPAPAKPAPASAAMATITTPEPPKNRANQIYPESLKVAEEFEKSGKINSGEAGLVKRMPPDDLEEFLNTFRIYEEIPVLEKEYEELKELRTFKGYDVTKSAPSDISQEDFQAATSSYRVKRNQLLTNWGVLIYRGAARVLRFKTTRERRPPLLIDLKKTVKEHLS